MPATVSHALSMTTPDDPAYENRPSHWNATHAMTLNATGSEISGAFSNANGISFGLSAGAVTASHVFNLSAGTTSNNLSKVTFNDAGGVSFGLNGSVITAAAPAGGGGITNINVSAGTTSNNLSKFTLADSNGISFGLDASTITASHNGLTSQSNQAVSAANGSYAFQTLSFSNANGMSFGTSAGSAITGSYTVPTITNSSFTVSDAATSGTVARLAFTNLNGVTLSLSTGAGGSHTIVGSHNGLTSQSNQALSGPNGSFTFQTAQFHNSNGVSWSTTTGSGIIASVAAQTNQTGGVYFVGNTTGQSSSSTFDARTLSIDGAGIVSAGWSNSTIRISATQSNQAFSAAGGSSAFQTLGFSDNGYASWTNTNGSVALTELRASLFAVSNTTQSSSGTQNIDALSFAGAGGVSVGVTNGSVVISGGGGGTTNQTGPNIAAGTQTATSGTVVFSNSNNISFGMSDSSVVTASFNAINVGVSTGGNTLGTTGTIEGAGGQYLFVGSSGITLSQSTNGANSGTVTILGTGDPKTLSGLDPFPFYQTGTNANGQASLFIWGRELPLFQCDRLIFPIQNTNSSNSSGSHTLSFWFGLYTRTSDSISLLTSTSSSTAVTHSGSQGSYSRYSGIRLFTIPFTTTLTSGFYNFAFISRTTSGGTNGTYRNVHLVGPSGVAAFDGIFGTAANATVQLELGRGIYSATTSGFPSTIAFTQLTGTDGSAMKPQMVVFGYSTF